MTEGPLHGFARDVWSAAGYPKDVPLPADIETRARQEGFDAGYAKAVADQKQSDLTVYGVFPGRYVDGEDGPDWVDTDGAPEQVFETQAAAEAYLKLLEARNKLNRKMHPHLYAKNPEMLYVIEEIKVRRDTPDSSI
jgi:hypothetical protein